MNTTGLVRRSGIAVNGNKIDLRPGASYQVGIVQFSHGEGIAQVLCDELIALGHTPVCLSSSVIPNEVDVVFSFGPYGNFLSVPSQLASMPVERRPTFVHWNTEGLPDLRLAWRLMSTMGTCRSWMGRLADSDNRWVRFLASEPPLSWINARMFRFRYVGDYYYAHRRGWMDVFADSSTIYARLHAKHGLPTIFAPWGATPRWYDNLKLERDIDVLWMGKRATKRRHNLLNRVRSELQAHGVQVHVADGVENPFIFGEERTQFLNRAKITLNLTRTWYDDNFSRFAMACPNRSLVVSEPLLPHCPYYEPGIHYVSAPTEILAETILYYLEHEEERLRIAENAYELVTTVLTFQNSIKTIMDAVSRA